ncbi:MAG: pyridoxal-phosphate dependent enzyme, partial [bacterium]
MKINTLPEITPHDIREAHARISPHINRTPVMANKSINKIVEASVFFKCENMQKVGAFKARGATNAVQSLEPGIAQHGVATHSSGNHAQALSWAASIAGIDAYIVMPSNSNRVKIAAVRDYGGKITFCEPTLKARETTLAKVVEETGAQEIHPYNDLRIIAGQATAALEFLEDTGRLDFMMTPVGGGGLLSGTALSCNYFGQGTNVIAAEPDQANDAYLSFIQKEFVPSLNPNTIADGLRTSLGDLTFPIILKYVSQIYTVKEATIISAMRLIWERLKILVEPSASVPLAVLMEGHQELKNKRIGI